MKIMSQDKKPRVLIRQQFTICNKKVDILTFGYDESSKTLKVSMDSSECNIEWIPYEKHKQPQVMDSPNQDIQFMTHDMDIMKSKIDVLLRELDKTNAKLIIHDNQRQELFDVLNSVVRDNGITKGRVDKSDERMDQWVKTVIDLTSAFNGSIERIAVLEEKVDELNEKMDSWIAIVQEMDKSTLDFKTIINEKLAHRVDALAGVMKDEISNLKHQISLEAKDVALEKPKEKPKQKLVKDLCVGEFIKPEAVKGVLKIIGMFHEERETPLPKGQPVAITYKHMDGQHKGKISSISCYPNVAMSLIDFDEQLQLSKK